MFRRGQGFLHFLPTIFLILSPRSECPLWRGGFVGADPPSWILKKLLKAQTPVKQAIVTARFKDYTPAGFKLYTQAGKGEFAERILCAYFGSETNRIWLMLGQIAPKDPKWLIISGKWPGSGTIAYFSVYFVYLVHVYCIFLVLVLHTGRPAWLL